MAPSTSGVRLVDQLRSEELSRTALSWAAALLCPGGRAVIKLFQGPGTRELMVEARSIFSRVKTFKPPGSRSESMETFLVATGFRAVDPN
jgi:23S rRNA (uridine2552-2'-O)-methyltransferase